jgi:hypothetical protein
VTLPSVGQPTPRAAFIRAARILAKTVAIALPSLLFIWTVQQWPAQLQRGARFAAIVGFLIVVFGIIAVAAIVPSTSRRAQRGVLVVLLGVVLVVAGSGVLQSGAVTSTHPLNSGDPLLRTYTVQTLHTLWFLIAIGGAIGLGGLGFIVLSMRSIPGWAARFFAIFPALALILMGAGTSYVAFVTGSFTVNPMDYTGRPIRRHRRIPASDRGDPPGGESPWMTAARQEAESVVAFVDLENRLRSVGAPAALSARCRTAARDEARHARLTCALARHVGDGAPATVIHRSASRPTWARRRGVARRSEIVRLALESLLDGSVGERRSADALDVKSAAAADPWVAGVLREIAKDEHGHAQLADDIVDWCASEMPRSVDLALRWARTSIQRQS